MGILKVDDPNQATTALTLSSPSNSCSLLEENVPKGSGKGNEKDKKRVRFEEKCNQTNLFTTTSAAAATHTPKKAACVCAPTTHAGSFRCRLHRAANSNHRSNFPLQRAAKHGIRAPKVVNSVKVPSHGSSDCQKSQLNKQSRFARTSAANVQQVTAGVHQMHLTK